LGQPAPYHPDLDRRQVEERRAMRRSEAQRDRDRILYSSAFQRLAGITQVSTPQPGLHNRLTHTLKVAQVARRIAEAWKYDAELQDAIGAFSTVQNLDPDAVEASGLAHDLGHPPFGHVAEFELADLARAYEGFEGNAQSFRIVNYLATGTVEETNYRGLNLTRRTLNGILKYPLAAGRWRTTSEDVRRVSGGRGRVRIRPGRVSDRHALHVPWGDGPTQPGGRDYGLGGRCHVCSPRS
jgi:dGTPase